MYINQYSSEGQRLSFIDIMRGFSLFGVFIVNANLLNTPYFHANKTFYFISTKSDRITNDIVHFLIVHKFLTLFAVLFGVSLSLYLQKKDFPLKRSFFLVIVGILHGVFIFWGDILFFYGAMSILIFPMIKFLNLKKQKVFLWILIVISICLKIYFLFAPIQYNFQADLKYIFLNSSFIDLAIERAKIFYYFNFWGIFEGGVKDFLLYLTSYLEVFCQIFFGLVYAQDIILFLKKTTILRTILLLLLSFIIEFYIHGDFILKSLIFFLSYSSSLYLLAEKLPPKLKEMMSSLGRMSLTHYLSFNFIMSIILYGYGFSYYGSIGPFLVTIFSMITFITQFVIGYFWFKKFRIGPAEKILKVLIQK